MIYKFLIFITFSLFAFYAKGNIILNGTYQGFSIYVQNPFADEGEGFCTDSVSLNGVIIDLEFNQSAF